MKNYEYSVTKRKKRNQISDVILIIIPGRWFNALADVTSVHLSGLTNDDRFINDLHEPAGGNMAGLLSSGIIGYCQDTTVTEISLLGFPHVVTQ